MAKAEFMVLSGGQDHAGSGHSAILDGESGTTLSVPGRGFLTAAEYHREGPDLVLVGENGQTVTITGYFANPHPPLLTSPDGSAITPDLAAKLAGPVAPGQFAQAGGGPAMVVVGTVSKLTGTVEVTHPDGTKSVLQAGDKVYQGDVIATKGDGTVALAFADSSTLSLGKSGRMVIDEMVYDPAAHTGHSTLSVVKGAFSLVSGQIAKSAPDASTLKTPVMTIGIRGTSVAGTADAEGQNNSVVLLQDPDGRVGQILVSTAGGAVVINQSNFLTTVNSFSQPPSPPLYTPATQIYSTYGDVISSQPSSPSPSTQPPAPAPAGPSGDQLGANGQTNQSGPQPASSGEGNTSNNGSGSGATGGGTSLPVTAASEPPPVPVTVVSVVTTSVQSGTTTTGTSGETTNSNTNANTGSQEQVRNDPVQDTPGSGSSGGVGSESGRAVDGYIKNATVWRDMDGDGVKDAGEYSTTTDVSGRYTLSGSGGVIIVQGGVDTTTNEQQAFDMKAPGGSSVVTPLTTLIVAIAGNNATSTQFTAAQVSVKALLGLSGISADLTTLDPIASFATSTEAKVVMAATVELMATVNVITQALNTIAGSGTPVAAADVLTALANMAGSGTFDFQNNSDLTSLITSVASGKVDLSSSASVISMVANTLATANANIHNAVTAATNYDAVADSIDTALSTGDGSLTDVIGDIATGGVNITDISDVHSNLDSLKAAGITEFRVSSGTATFSAEEAAGITIENVDYLASITLADTAANFMDHAGEIDPESFSHLVITDGQDIILSAEMAERWSNAYFEMGSGHLIVSFVDGDDASDLSLYNIDKVTAENDAHITITAEQLAEWGESGKLLPEFATAHVTVIGDVSSIDQSVLDMYADEYTHVMTAATMTGDGSWLNSAKWTGAILPDSDLAARIEGADAVINAGNDVSTKHLEITDGGSLVVNGSLSVNVDLYNESAGVVADDSSFTLASGAVFNLTSTFVLLGTVSIASGSTVNVVGDGGLTIADGSTVIADGAAIDGLLTVQAGSLEILGSVLYADSAYDLRFRQEGGETRVLAEGDITLAFSDTDLRGGSFILDGSEGALNVTLPGQLYISGGFSDNSGQLVLTGNNAVSLSTNGYSIYCSGTIISGGTGTSPHVINANISTSDTALIDVQRDLRINGQLSNGGSDYPGQIHVAAGAVLSVIASYASEGAIDNSGLIWGDGTIVTDLGIANKGTINAGGLDDIGTLTIDGGVDLDTYQSILEMEFSEEGADKLVFTDAVTLNGTLSLDVDPNADLNMTDYVTIIDGVKGGSFHDFVWADESGGHSVASMRLSGDELQAKINTFDTIGTFTGSTGVDIVLGADDIQNTLDGGGGADILFGGDSEDTFIVRDDQFARVVGGGYSDTDTLVLADDGTDTVYEWGGMTLEDRLDGIEKVVIGDGDSTARSILHLTGDSRMSDMYNLPVFEVKADGDIYLYNWNIDDIDLTDKYISGLYSWTDCRIYVYYETGASIHLQSVWDGNSSEMRGYTDFANVMEAGYATSIYGGQYDDHITVTGTSFDTVVGGSGLDTLTITLESGLFYFDGTAFQPNVGNRLSGIESIEIIGTSGADTIYGGSAVDLILDGNGGADLLWGTSGDDTFIVRDDLFVTVAGGGGNDTLTLAGPADAGESSPSTDFGWDGRDLVSRLSSIEKLVLGDGDGPVKLTLGTEEAAYFDLSGVTKTISVDVQDGSELYLAEGWQLGSITNTADGFSMQAQFDDVVLNISFADRNDVHYSQTASSNNDTVNGVSGLGNELSDGWYSGTSLIGHDQDDTFTITNAGFASIAGGSGTDTLVLSETDTTSAYSLTTAKVSGIERISLSDSIGSDKDITLTLSAAFVTAASGTNTLYIDGKTWEDTVSFADSGWVRDDNANVDGYTVYHHDNATVAISNNLSQPVGG